LINSALYYLHNCRHWKEATNGGADVKKHIPNVKKGRPGIIAVAAKEAGVTSDQVLSTLQESFDQNVSGQGAPTIEKFGQYASAVVGGNPQMAEMSESSARRLTKELDINNKGTAYNQNRKRQEGMLDIYNQIAHIVALRAAFGFLESTTPQGFDEGEISARNPLKCFNIDASSHFLAESLEKSTKKILQ
jgi:hypothetical protein